MTDLPSVSRRLHCLLEDARGAREAFERGLRAFKERAHFPQVEEMQLLSATRALPGARGKLSVAEAAADAFKTFKIPRTLTQVRSFLGACNVYRRFAKGFAKIARPLTDMTRKDADPNYDNPTAAQVQALEDLKSRMIAPPIFALPRYGRPYMIDTDASAYKLGCTLLQEHDGTNDWRPVGYWSYSLNDSERNYSATERECFAVV